MLQAAQIRGGKRMREIELSAGMIEYEDTGGGPVVVLLPGLAMDSSLWRHVVRELRGGVAGDPL
jgi:pimeloyl-ACP methyl ester carboxylesterase